MGADPGRSDATDAATTWAAPAGLGAVRTAYAMFMGSTHDARCGRIVWQVASASPCRRGKG
jgi:hypothetical protein